MNFSKTTSKSTENSAEKVTRPSFLLVVQSQ
uniref:Uncharacterized protein n=1 Tax=Anguilla anguilla TaxID=7936 RepID=A0A0E9PCF0_ANGAN